ncbi:hypothetical protein BKA70DRAFT_1448762 [Coprinopsis sp. MPI-PUGE-AT-0042]|nr:hypothetical protein BKA70DRAFT_1448762 [Coprinopsis sp. MPI-PUGE-AT-0042]
MSLVEEISNRIGSLVRRYRRHQYRFCLSGFLAVPLWFGGYRKKPSVGPPSSPIRWSSSTFIQTPPKSSHSTAALRRRPGQIHHARPSNSRHRPWHRPCARLAATTSDPASPLPAEPGHRPKSDRSTPIPCIVVAGVSPIRQDLNDPEYGLMVPLSAWLALLCYLLITVPFLCSTSQAVRAFVNSHHKLICAK